MYLAGGGGGGDRVEGRKYSPLHRKGIKKTQKKSMETTKILQHALDGCVKRNIAKINFQKVFNYKLTRLKHSKTSPSLNICQNSFLVYFDSIW